MIIVENRFEIRAGAADAVVDRFRSPKSVHTFPGFVRMEVLHAVLSDETEEVRICTAWESEEAFNAWTNSDAFRQAHTRRGEAAGGAARAEEQFPQQEQHAQAHAAPEQGHGAQASGAEHAAHGSSQGGHASGGASANSPVISSKVTTYNVVVSHLPAEAAAAEAGT